MSGAMTPSCASDHRIPMQQAMGSRFAEPVTQTRRGIDRERGIERERERERKTQKYEYLLKQQKFLELQLQHPNCCEIIECNCNGLSSISG